MKTTNLNVIIKPIINEVNNKNPFLTTKECQTSIEVDSNTLLKDVCKVVLEQNGIGHLAFTSKAFIEAPGSRSINCETFYPDKEINIDIVRNLVGNPFIIVIYAHGEVEDFCEATLRKSALSSLLDFLHNNEPSHNNLKMDPIVKKFIEYIKNNSNEKTLDRNLSMINDNLVNGTNCHNNITLRTPVHPNSTSKVEVESRSRQAKKYLPSQANSPTLGVNVNLYNHLKEKSIISGSPLLKTPLSSRLDCKSRKTKLNQLREVNSLRQIYQNKGKLTTSEIIQFTKKINAVCKRPGNLKITPYQVSSWLKNRKFKSIERSFYAEGNVTL
ncbi:Hypothetical protein SRAE_1000047400 [Strongyloides ratti]|uniref:Uncharacterized protein n=1 Tax=Strongyloides ratti TaxID=34506 RepID=A0A090KXJ8_STRRB|nr:Hypothetical protein SRAE_1000047400 [Strongyloides ratti]CEF62200.1 Hypothetical protein SRAE_1000047400 [Strongyloides ratti]